MSHLLFQKYILDVAQSFNKYYGNVRILEESKRQQTRIGLCCDGCIKRRITFTWGGGT